MTTIAEMVAKFKERIEKNPELQEFIAKAKAKAEAERKAKLEAQAKLASMLKDKSEEE